MSFERLRLSIVHLAHLTEAILTVPCLPLNIPSPPPLTHHPRTYPLPPIPSGARVMITIPICNCTAAASRILGRGGRLHPSGAGGDRRAGCRSRRAAESAFGGKAAEQD